MNTLKTISLFITFSIFINYIYYVYTKFGILKSISASFYKVKSRFRFFIWGISISSTTFCFDERFRWVLFAGLVFLFSVGVFADFRRRTILYLHSIGATGGIAFIMLSFWIYDGMWILPLSMAFIGVVLWFSVKNPIWAIEVAAFILSIIGFFIIL